MVPMPVCTPRPTISPNKLDPPGSPEPPLPPTAALPPTCCAAYGPPPSSSASSARAVVNEYEKMCGMFAGGTPPPWSRMRRQSTALPCADAGGGAIVSCTGGMGVRDPEPCVRWCRSTLARKLFLRISVRMYSRCTGM